VLLKKSSEEVGPEKVDWQATTWMILKRLNGYWLLEGVVKCY